MPRLRYFNSPRQEKTESLLPSAYVDAASCRIILVLRLLTRRDAATTITPKLGVQKMARTSGGLFFNHKAKKTKIAFDFQEEGGKA